MPSSSLSPPLSSPLSPLSSLLSLLSPLSSLLSSLLSPLLSSLLSFVTMSVKRKANPKGESWGLIATCPLHLQWAATQPAQPQWMRLCLR